jgi:uncharacterized protein (TIGR03067 family)
MNLLLCVALAVGAPGVKDPPKKGGPAILGEWTLESWTIGGRAMLQPMNDHPNVFTFLPDGTMTVKLHLGRGERTETDAYKMDDKKTPAEIDLIPGEAGNGSTMYGIFKIDKDTLTIRMGDERPTKFESAGDAKTMVLVLKRVVKK